MRGKIVKGIGGFYYVNVPEKGLYECKAKGTFRNQNIKPLVGDNVIMDVIDESKMIGNIASILPRENELIRPAVANVSQALIVFAIREPEPNYNMLTRFLIMMELQNVPTIVVFNKTDLAGKEDIVRLAKEYEKSGHKVIFISNYEKQGIDEIRSLLADKTTVLAGPSGVGKSTLLNLLGEADMMETGSISQKIKRGRHTTRHSEIFELYKNTYILDTPGFTSLYVSDIKPEELKDYFEEFASYNDKCRFSGCVHINEPDCAVKDALQKGTVSKLRYNNYVEIYNELKNQKKY